jgi:hypothetical protein
VSGRFATPKAYRGAFSLLEAGMPLRHRLLLEVHYRAPRHTATARSLAAGVGYAHYGAANLQYGVLCRRICEILGLRLPYHVLVIAEFVTPKDPRDSELLWVMRPEVARALEGLQWV